MAAKLNFYLLEPENSALNIQSLAQRWPQPPPVQAHRLLPAEIRGCKIEKP
jgi:hypothetical protein